MACRQPNNPIIQPKVFKLAFRLNNAINKCYKNKILEKAII